MADNAVLDAGKVASFDLRTFLLRGFTVTFLTAACASSRLSTPLPTEADPTEIVTPTALSSQATHPTPTDKLPPPAFSKATASAPQPPETIDTQNVDRLTIFSHWETLDRADLAWSPDGTRIATSVTGGSLGDVEGEIMLMQLPGLGVVWKLDTLPGDILFQSGIDVLVAVEYSDHSINVIDATEGAIIKQLADDDCGDMAPFYLRLDDAGSRLFAGISASGLGVDYVYVYEWDLVEGQCRGLFVRHSGELQSLDLSPDGSTLAVGIFNAGPPYVAQVHLWNVNSRELRCWFRSADAAISPLGDVIAVANHETETLEFYNPTTCELILDAAVDLPTPSNGYQIAYTADGGLLAIGQQSIRILDTSNGDLLGELEIEGYLGDILFSPDGRYLAASSCYPCSITLWSVTNDQ